MLVPETSPWTLGCVEVESYHWFPISAFTNSSAKMQDGYSVQLYVGNHGNRFVGLGGTEQCCVSEQDDPAEE